MTTATTWIAGTKYEGHGKDMNGALEALKKGWEQTCAAHPDKDKSWLVKHAEDIKYTDG